MEAWTGEGGAPRLRLGALPDTVGERYATLLALAWCDAPGFLEAAAREDVQATTRDDHFRETAVAASHGLTHGWLPLPAETGALERHLETLPAEARESWQWAARMRPEARDERLPLAQAFERLPEWLHDAAADRPQAYLESAPARGARKLSAALAGRDDGARLLRAAADLAYVELLPVARHAADAASPKEEAGPEDEAESGPPAAAGEGADPGAREDAPGKTDGEGPWDYWVHYGTNRAPVDEDDPDAGYANVPDPHGRLHRGRCKVHVPKTHKFGELGSDDWSWLPWVESDALELRDVERLERAAFLAGLRASLAHVQPGRRDIVVYVHGYNNDFEAAALRAAQIGFDLKVPGPMAFFSWPSHASVGGYKGDGARVLASVDALELFLRELARETGAEELHLIVHSMGNRGMAAAIERLEDTADVRFGQIILAAPDITPERFREVAQAYGNLSARTTLYVSAKDRALGLSQWINDGPRAGYTPPVTVQAPIDTVEVTEIDLTALGHSYYAEAEAVLYDIHELLISGREPAQRLRVRPVFEQGYWRIAP